MDHYKTYVKNILERRRRNKKKNNPTQYDNNNNIIRVDYNMIYDNEQQFHNILYPFVICVRFAGLD